jgi:hypothetical protein
MKLNKINAFHTMVGLFIFGLFFWISFATPYAGDDWAFHNNTMNSGIVNATMGMFYGWEGRFFSLLGIHSIILHKSVWNILNALVYVVLYVFSLKIVKPKFHLIHALLFITLLVTIKDNVRMEIFTWITGSVYYALPMIISVVYAWILHQTLQKQVSRVYVVIGALCAFYLPLGMENIAIASVLVTVGSGMFNYYREKKIEWVILIYLISFALAFFIWSLSPGSDIRLARMPDWQTLGFFEKIMRQLPGVTFYTFYQNKYLVMFLSLLYVFLLYQSRIGRIKFYIIGFLLFSLPILFSQSIVRFSPSIMFLNLLTDGVSWVNTLYWILYAAAILVTSVYLDVIQQKFYYTYYLLFATLSSAALLLSPVLGYRLMIFSIVFMIIIVLAMVQDIKINRSVYSIVSVGLILLSLVGIRQWVIKYNSVQQITRERQAIIMDYYEYADLYNDGIWLPRYPIYSIHAGDIEFENTYHMEAFKTFFNIPQEETITFYWKEFY